MTFALTIANPDEQITLPAAQIRMITRDVYELQSGLDAVTDGRAEVSSLRLLDHALMAGEIDFEQVEPSTRPCANC